jgi:transporter family-2 protein
MALLNGGLVGLSRLINGHLGATVGPMRASLWNHLVGLLFLTLLLIAMGRWPIVIHARSHVFEYLGGLFGALFVAINSYALSKLGATRTTLFVIGAQMLTAVLLDTFHTGRVPGGLGYLGVAVVLGGLCMFNARAFSPKES